MDALPITHYSQQSLTILRGWSHKNHSVPCGLLLLLRQANLLQLFRLRLGYQHPERVRPINSSVMGTEPIYVLQKLNAEAEMHRWRGHPQILCVTTWLRCVYTVHTPDYSYHP